MSVSIATPSAPAAKAMASSLKSMSLQELSRGLQLSVITVEEPRVTSTGELTSSLLSAPAPPPHAPPPRPVPSAAVVLHHEDDDLLTSSAAPGWIWLHWIAFLCSGLTLALAVILLGCYLLHRRRTVRRRSSGGGVPDRANALAEPVAGVPVSALESTDGPPPPMGVPSPVGLSSPVGLPDDCVFVTLRKASLGARRPFDKPQPPPPPPPCTPPSPLRNKPLYNTSPSPSRNKPLYNTSPSPSRKTPPCTSPSRNKPLYTSPSPLRNKPLYEYASPSPLRNKPLYTSPSPLRNTSLARSPHLSPRTPRGPGPLLPGPLLSAPQISESSPSSLSRRRGQRARAQVLPVEAVYGHTSQMHTDVALPPEGIRRAASHGSGESGHLAPSPSTLRMRQASPKPSPLRARRLPLGVRSPNLDGEWSPAQPLPSAASHTAHTTTVSPAFRAQQLWLISQMEASAASPASPDLISDQPDNG